MQEQAIFTEALEKQDPAERAAFLDRVCAGNPALRKRIEGLLARHHQDGDFLDAPARVLSSTVETPLTEGPGSIIGPYRLMEQIGAGGMGLVFVAEQQQPVRRRVALKVIKPGMDTREVIARFEAERQALALMDHPNIARVLDVGTTPSGRPYFVMELVRGVPITKFCDDNRLTTRERLDLFVHVCQAAQHAHQKGIIHRDIKPSNVLVTLHDGTPVVKVIDFGVAKAVGQQLTDKTVYTGFMQMIGTPLYMSPEQAEMSALDVDTRSDIYSLGVLLYELLTGTTPFDKDRLKMVGVDEIRRIIREEEPPKPSTRISTLGQLASTVSTQRKSDPGRLKQLVRGELDWIVMKALEKDRNRRYETASAFSADIQRYLADETVHACPPSAGYRLRKFGRKYRTMLRVAAIAVVVLLLAATVSTWQAVRATLAERQAVVERDRAETSFRMARDAVDRLFLQVSQSPKLKAYPMQKFRKDLLLNAGEFYERFIREQFDAPGVRHDLGLAHYRLAEIHREIGDYAAAETAAAKAVAILGDLSAAQPGVTEYERDLAAAYMAQGRVEFDTAHWEKAEAAYRKAAAIQEKQVRDNADAPEFRYALANTYNAWGLVYFRLAARTELAADKFQRALDILTKLVQEQLQGTEYQALYAAAQLNIGQVHISKGADDKAETALREAQNVYGRLLRGPADAPAEYKESLAKCLTVLGWLHNRQSHYEKAEANQQEAMQIFEKLTKEHPDVLEYMYDVGRCQSSLAQTADHAGRSELALARYDKAIAIMEEVIGKGYLATKTTLLELRINRCAALAGRGDHARAVSEAEPLSRHKDLRPVDIYNAGCAYARAATAADRDAKLPPAERAALKTRYADRAVELVREAIAKGWDKLGVIKNDPDLAALQARDDFQKLLGSLNGKQPVDK